MKIFRIFTYPLLAAVALLSGCKSDDVEVPEQTLSAVPVNFTIRLSETGQTRSDNSGTRAGDPSNADDIMNGSEEGTVFDKTINTLDVVLYRVIGNEINYRYPVGSLTISADEMENIKRDTDGDVEIKGVLNTEMRVSDLTDYKYRLAVFINAPSNLNIANPGAATFERHGTPDDITAGIPMFGIQDAYFTGIGETSEGNEFTIKSDEEGTQPLSVSVLRAMAKIKVNIANQDLIDKRNMKLVSLEINQHANKGFMLPKNWMTVSNLANQPMKSLMNAYTGSGNYTTDEQCLITAPQTDPTESWKNSSKMLRFYCPESYNSTKDDINGTEIITLKVKFLHDGVATPTEKEIFLCKYYDQGENKGQPNKTEPWDIVRNCIYEFNITNIAPHTGDLSVQVSVNKWQKVHFDLDADDIMQ